MSALLPRVVPLTLPHATQATWSWEQCVSAIRTDARSALLKVGEMKQIYFDFLQILKLRKKEAETRKENTWLDAFEGKPRRHPYLCSCCC